MVQKNVRIFRKKSEYKLNSSLCKLRIIAGFCKLISIGPLG